MSIQANEPTPRKPLRLWPGVAAAVLLLFIRFVLPVVAPKAEFFGMDTGILAILGGLVLAVVIVLWWLLFSRAPWFERLGALAVMIVAVVATRPLTDISIQNGMMGRMFFIYAVPPTITLALVAWAVASRRLSRVRGAPRWSWRSCWAALVWTLVRTNGILGGAADLAWRWTPSAEQRLLAQGETDPLPPAAPAETVKEPVAAEAANPAAPAPAPGATKTEPTAPATAKDADRAVGQRSRTEASRMARLSRARSGRRRSSRADQHRLGDIAAGRDVAPAHRPWLVVIRGPGGSLLHPRAARPPRGRHVLQGQHRPAGLETSRRGEILGVERWHWSARDARHSATVASTRWVEPES